MDEGRPGFRVRLRRWALNCYPPFIGAGIRVQRLSPDLREVKVRMALRWYNRNVVGMQFGGSLYAMTDPFFMLMLLHNLGNDYIVWDQAANIRFISPGRGEVFAEFRVDEALLADIRRQTADGRKYLPRLHVDVRDGQGTLVARVEKTLYVRLKPERLQRATG